MNPHIRDMRNPGFVSNSGLPEERSWRHVCACFPTYEPTLGPNPIWPGAQTNWSVLDFWVSAKFAFPDLQIIFRPAAQQIGRRVSSSMQSNMGQSKPHPMKCFWKVEQTGEPKQKLCICILGDGTSAIILRSIPDAKHCYWKGPATKKQVLYVARCKPLYDMQRRWDAAALSDASAPSKTKAHLRTFCAV